LSDSSNIEKERRHKDFQKEANKIFRNEKRRYAQDILREMNHHYRNNRTKQVYQNINKVNVSFKKRNKFLAGVDGTLITSQQDIEKKWMECFEILLNCEEPIEISMATDEVQRRRLPSTFATRSRMAD